MLTVKPQLNLKNAKGYFREHLCEGDYHSEGKRIAGEWFGEAAEKLGLSGIVAESDFLSLCEGLNPKSGERLTLRHNTTRLADNGQNVANRRVFYDFVVGPPKSVSVVALMCDDRILNLHHQALGRALVELERFAQSRVRKCGKDDYRSTGNIVAACFRHETSRELDPHLHSHCVVFNATFDSSEARWKALEVEGMYRAQRFVENCYFHELAKGLHQLGYKTEAHGRAFRIKGVPETVTHRFSKRHHQIDEESKRKESEGWKGNIKDLREQIAHDVRRRKVPHSTAERLRPSWKQQLTAEETKALEALRPAPTPPEKVDAAKILTWAEEHLFERRSVVHDYELMAAALEHGRGRDFELGALRAAVEQRGYIREVGTRRLTSLAVLHCELGIVVAAHDGRGKHLPLNPNFLPAKSLSSEQSLAVSQILKSRDFITLFRGVAGTGKSFTLREVTQGLRAGGHPVVVLAPQRQQVSDLTNDGLLANTLAHCLQTKQLPQRAVVLVDEAGQIGGQQLSELIALVQKHDGRLILSGDTRQHGAVQASDALRAIENLSGLKPAVLREIRRQNPDEAKWVAERAFVTAYRDAVKAASLGRTAESFERLDRLGCIREVAPDDRRDVLADEYLESLGRKERTLVISQTWEEVNAVNDAIRAKLQKSGRIGAGVALKTYQTFDLSTAQKRDARAYAEGQFAYVIQRYGRFAKGDLCPIVGTNDRGVVLMKNGRRSTMSYRHTHRLAIAVERETTVAPGDRLQLKFNGKSKDGVSITNGELVTVRSVGADGSLKVEDDRRAMKTLSPDQRLFNRGYAVTSYASQGKTVDTVILADASSRAATNRNQWYVSISRGRKRVVVFTHNKAELHANIDQTGDRDLALEMNLPARSIRRKLLPRMPDWTRSLARTSKLREAAKLFIARRNAGAKITL